VPVERPTYTNRDIIRRNVKQVGFEAVDWNQVAQYRRSFVDKEINI
jgi:hypothetical protein